MIPPEQHVPDPPEHSVLADTPEGDHQQEREHLVDANLALGEPDQVADTALAAVEQLGDDDIRPRDSCEVDDVLPDARKHAGDKHVAEHVEVAPSDRPNRVDMDLVHFADPNDHRGNEIDEDGEREERDLHLLIYPEPHDEYAGHGRKR